MPGESFFDIIDRLEDLIEQNSLEAKIVSSELVEELAGTKFHQQVRHLDAKVRQFDFVEAGKLLEKMRPDLVPVPGEKT